MIAGPSILSGIEKVSPASISLGSRMRLPEGRRMVVGFDRVHRRIKSRTWPLGAARFRMFRGLWQLGLHREEREARIRSELELARIVELDRQAELVAEAARLAEQRAFVEAIESRRIARRLQEARDLERMSDKQRANWEMEEQIVRWMSD